MVRKLLKQHESFQGDFHIVYKYGCEIVDFKQAYIEQNFNGEVFADITKMCQEKTPTAFGGEKKVPHVKILVAGTSCKSFSTLNQNQQLNEDSISGETFFAFVNLLYKNNTEFAIIENVDGAPWTKMCEFVTGRIPFGQLYNKLGSSYNKKETKNTNKQGPLTLKIDKEGFVVHNVPSNVAVMQGAFLVGVRRASDDENDIEEFKISETLKSTSTPFNLSVIADEYQLEFDDVLIFRHHHNKDGKQNYSCVVQKVSSEKYGLPQVRHRKYMFIWQTKSFPTNAGELWKELFVYQESPVPYAVVDYLEKPTGRHVQRLRRMQRGVLGQNSAQIIAFKSPERFQRSKGK